MLYVPEGEPMVAESARIARTRRWAQQLLPLAILLAGFLGLAAQPAAADDPTPTPGPNDCCQCDSACVSPSSGDCAVDCGGSGVAVYGAVCADTSCATPTPTPTATPVSCCIASGNGCGYENPVCFGGVSQEDCEGAIEASWEVPNYPGCVVTSFDADCSTSTCGATGGCTISGSPCDNTGCFESIDIGMCYGVNFQQSCVGVPGEHCDGYATETPTATLTPTPGPNDCCQCDSSCVAPSSGDCAVDCGGSGEAVYGAVCTDTSCATPTPTPTVTPVIGCCIASGDGCGYENPVCVPGISQGDCEGAIEASWEVPNYPGCVVTSFDAGCSTSTCGATGSCTISGSPCDSAGCYESMTSVCATA